MKKRLCIVTVCAGVVATAAASHSALGGTPLTTVRVASGLSSPVFATASPGDLERIFILEQVEARIKIRHGDGTVTTFLDIDDRVSSSGGERGLLGLAFHPNYEANGFFYVHYNDNLGDTVISRFSRIDDDNADPNSEVRVMFADQPFSNHNGGWIGFGPDGYLYIALGDGGSSCDPGQRAQDITDQPLGKMLRLDIDGDDFPVDPNKNYANPPSNPFVGVTGDDEIWAYGLRNSWRDSFDRATGDLYIADVGQGLWEEIDFQPASSAGGENYGWDCMEGNHCSSGSGCGAGACVCLDPSLVIPIQEYVHSGGNCSITGGYVYRGCEIPDLRGTYFYADYCTAKLWSFRYDGVSVTEFTDRTTELAPGGGLSINLVTSFGEDGYGEMYIVDHGGEVFKIVPDGPVQGDCAAALPGIAATRSVNTHGLPLGQADLGIAVDVDASVQVDSGAVTTETRESGVTRLEITFADQLDPSVGALGAAAVTITPDPGAAIATSLANGDTTLVLEFTPAWPNTETYAVELSDQVIALGAATAGDRDFELRALLANVASESGPGPQQVNAIDLGLSQGIRGHLAEPVTDATALYDLNEDGVIDALDISCMRLTCGAWSTTAP